MTRSASQLPSDRDRIPQVMPADANQHADIFDRIMWQPDIACGVMAAANHPLKTQRGSPLFIVSGAPRVKE